MSQQLNLQLVPGRVSITFISSSRWPSWLSVGLHWGAGWNWPQIESGWGHTHTHWHGILINYLNLIIWFPTPHLLWGTVSVFSSLYLWALRLHRSCIVGLNGEEFYLKMKICWQALSRCQSCDENNPAFCALFNIIVCACLYSIFITSLPSRQQPSAVRAIK